MKILKKTIASLVITFIAWLSASAQTQYEYVQIQDSRFGQSFEFGSKYDSAKFYNKMKFKSYIDAVEHLQSKGWELFTITTTFECRQDQVNLLGLINTAIMRRKKSPITN